MDSNLVCPVHGGSCNHCWRWRHLIWQCELGKEHAPIDYEALYCLGDKTLIPICKAMLGVG